MSTSNAVLVVYYSVTGNTARVARDLAARLNADIEIIHDKARGTGVLGRLSTTLDAWRQAPAKIGALRRNPEDYAITVVGTPVWNGQITPAARAYLNQTARRTQSVAFFITSSDTDISQMARSLEAAAGRTAVAAEGFTAADLADAATYETMLADFAYRIAHRIARRYRAVRKAA